MKKSYLVIFVLILAVTLVFLARDILKKKNISVPADNSVSSQNTPPDSANQSSLATQVAPDSQNMSAEQNTAGFYPPLDRAGGRVTKKPFGIFITPQTSLIQPEKFRGYHTGTDFEIFLDELDADVPVRAICDGTVALKKYASGYGGVLVQNCELDNQPITVTYGHLKLASIQKSVGDNLTAGETTGILGKAYSTETDGERKHFHLGIHKGTSVNILGYVQSKSQLSEWIDACSLVCR